MVPTTAPIVLPPLPAFDNLISTRKYNGQMIHWETYQRGDEPGVLSLLARHHDVGRGQAGRHESPGCIGPQPPSGMGSEGSRRWEERRQ